MNNKQISKECYKNFSKKEGNQHIAGEFGLKKILDIIDINKPKNILEVGLGIGSVSFTILKKYEKENSEITYHGSEANQFCLEALKENLHPYYDSISIYENLQSINSNIKYDFIIIDGSDEAIEQIKNLINRCGVIFIEGWRGKQMDKMKAIFPNHRHTTCISDYKNPKHGPFSEDNWSGGGQLIYINPTLKQNIHFLKERLKTAYRYKISRKIKLALNRKH